jgi:hypothetical protein
MIKSFADMIREEKKNSKKSNLFFADAILHSSSAVIEDSENILTQE